MKKNEKKGMWLSGILFVIALGCAAASVCLFANYFSGRNSGSEGTTNSQAMNRTIEVDGVTYTYNYDLTNILFIGIDKGSEVDTYAAAGEAGQADCVMILSLDSTSKEARVLQISRDTMTGIDIYSSAGRKISEITAQLALQYAYGLGGEQSCLAMKTTVGELLEGVTIDGYVALDIDAVSLLNDAVGGVTLTFDDDYTYIDESYTEGATVTLEGTAAEHFIRYRDTSVTGSNNGRMRRQVLYITALIQTMTSKTDNAGDYYSRFYSLVSDYLATDLTADEINELATYSFRSDETVYAPGETVEGEEHDEFYLDEDEMLRTVAEIFYKIK